jgi:hypothetical protein
MTDSYSYRYGSSSSGSKDLSIRDTSGKLRPWIKKEEYEKSTKEDAVARAENDIERYLREIDSYKEKIAGKKAIIAEKKKELGEESSIGTFKVGNLFVSPLMIPLFINIILLILQLYYLYAQKSNLSVLYNTVYQSLITALAASFILLLLLAFILSQNFGKNVNIGYLIATSGIFIVLSSSVIDEIGKIWTLSDGRTFSVDKYVSPRWMYWNIVIQVGVIIAVIYYHDKFEPSNSSKSQSDS